MWRAPRHIWRLIRTGATFERTGALAVILEDQAVPRAAQIPIRAVGRLFGLLGASGDPSLPPVARACQAMGPAYVKFGQILSTRPDIVGNAIVEQLRVLQDRLPAFPLEQARATIETELGPEGAALFEEIEPPVAAASIAQVHPARWRDTGQRVAIKVLRPGVAQQFRADIGSFYFIAGAVELIAPFARRLRPRMVVGHFESVVLTELDLRLEAASASQFRDNTRADPRFRVPRVFWEGTGRRVLTLEWCEGLPFNAPAVVEAGQDCSEIATRLLQTFLNHALRDGFFHGDMHQGNLRLDRDGTIIAMDFGIMGRLDAITRRHFAEIIYGFVTRNYRRVAEVHIEAGYVPADRDVDEFALALRSISEPIFNQDASRISMARLLAYLLETTERFGMETRTELILLQRTMLVVEGVSRSLDPRCNIWRAAAPVVETWISENLGPRQAVRDLRDGLMVLSRLGPRLPGVAEEMVMLAEEARLKRLRGPVAVDIRAWPSVASRLGLMLAFALGAALALAAVVMLD
ncbi:MAG: 2-polyprenylphenol 6-hydroxylase [Pseudomonadota bacterium]